MWVGLLGAGAGAYSAKTHGGARFPAHALWSMCAQHFCGTFAMPERAVPAPSHPEQPRGRPSLPPASLPRRVASPHGSARARVPRLRAERGAPPVPRQSAEGPWSELPPVGTPGAEARPVQQLLRVHFKRRVQHTRHLCVREVGDEKPAPRPCVGERADEGELTIPARLCHVKTASNSTRWSSQFLSVGQIFRNGLAGRFWPGAYPGASAKVSARAAGT